MVCQMGIFYTNTTLQTSDLRSVIVYMKKNKRSGYILPRPSRFVVLYDQVTEDQNPTVIEKLSSELSEQLACIAFSILVHDSDVFAYWLYQQGQLLDEYNSIPAYFDDDVDPAPSGGNAQKLCQIFGVPEAVEQVFRIFQTVKIGVVEDIWSDGYLMGEDIHRKLVSILQLPLMAVGAGYYTIENDFISDDFPKSELIRVN